LIQHYIESMSGTRLSQARYSLDYARPAYAEEYARLIHGHIEFDCKRPGVLLPLDILDVPSPYYHAQMWNQAQYLLALRKNWLVAPSFNEDNHHQNWGDSKHATGVFTNELSRLGIRKAITGRRTFATLDDTASIRMKADDVCWMGSELEGLGDTTLTVVARDKQDADGFKRIVLLGPNGGELDSHACNGKNPCTATFSRSPKEATHFVALAIQSDGDRVISAPIWYRK